MIDVLNISVKLNIYIVFIVIITIVIILLPILVSILHRNKAI